MISVLLATLTAMPVPSCSHCCERTCHGDDLVSFRIPAYTGPDRVEADRSSRIDPDRSLTVPAWSSRPGAPSVIYLDFDGHTDTSRWADEYTESQPIVTIPFDVDGDPGSFTAQELTLIERTWRRVAEDFAPFDVDVTTVEPAAVGTPAVSLRVVIGGDGAWAGSPGGIAFLDAWLEEGDVPVYAFPANLGNGSPRQVSLATSHEVGHALGLQHQAEWSSGVLVSEYHLEEGVGPSSWGPIMGAPFYANLTTWHDGPTPFGESDLQDDMAIITRPANAIGYAADDHAAATGPHAPLNPSSEVFIQGVIGANGDVDGFSFLAVAGPASFLAEPVDQGPNLDILLTLRDAEGTVIAQDDQPLAIDASIDAVLEAGWHTIEVSGSGAYGRVGGYTLTGTYTPGVVCAGDVTGDNVTNVFDFTAVVSNFGIQSGATRAQGDVNADGAVNVFDFTLLTGDFGCGVD